MLATNNVCTLFTNYYGLQVFWTSSPPSGFRQWLRVAAHLDQRTNEKAYGTCRLQSPQPRRARAQSSDDFGDRLAHSTPECRRANNPPRAVVSLAANQPALQVISSISANPRWRLTLGSSRAPSKGRGRHRRRSGARQAENCRSQNPGCTRSHGQLPHRFVSFRSNRLLCAPAPYRHCTSTGILSCFNNYRQWVVFLRTCWWAQWSCPPGRLFTWRAVLFGGQQASRIAASGHTMPDCWTNDRRNAIAPKTRRASSIPRASVTDATYARSERSPHIQP